MNTGGRRELSAFGPQVQLLGSADGKAASQTSKGQQVKPSEPHVTRPREPGEVPFEEGDILYITDSSSIN